MNANQAAESLLASNQQKELEDLPKDYPLSTSEDEGDKDEERKHQKLLESISSLNGKDRQKLADRSEASLKVSEFSVSSEGSGEKLVLSDLLEPVKTSSSLAAVKKQLNRVKSKKTVELPLHREEIERAGTPLEQEIFNLLHKNKQPVTDPLLTPVEKASLKAMSLEEVKMRRAELQRARALQSYYEARARREKRIKSKKYHRILKKGKAKQALKDFEKLQKVNPAAALEELEKLDKARMMERMSLKHQNSGKWAKSKAIMAKYDLEARQAMQEQLARNKELTQKVAASESEEEGEGQEEEEEPLVPDLVNEVQIKANGLNPWMFRNHFIDAKEAEVQKDLEDPAEPEAQETSESEEEKAVVEEETLLKEFEERRSLRQKSELNHMAEPVHRRVTKDPSSQEVLSDLRALCQKLSTENHQSGKQELSSARTAQREEPAREEEEPMLLQRPERARTLDELEELGREGCVENEELPRTAVEGLQLEKNLSNHIGAPKEKKRKEQMIDLQNLLTTKSPSVKSLAVPTTVQELEDEEERDQRQIIKEAFAGDDVIRDFLKEKREAVEASKPKDLDLTLPGWGEWGGIGLKPSAKKRRRFLIKAPEGPPRKDKNLPNVIINEKRNTHAAAHQVQVLPHPFTHHQQFERTIQTPGSTWNTQRAFQKLTMPKVVTKPGHIIKPIKAEDVGYRSSSRSDLSVIQRNPKRLSIRHKKHLENNCVD
uniref:U3 small nucleolar RNA-associated protein 14 homolog A n=1 Tax=Bos mutus grunniens TaxID=30521 RepID=A0A8B9WX49_BOSMU